MAKKKENKLWNNFFGSIDFTKFKANAGKLILAEPLLQDQYFARTVVFLIEHNEEGTVGFILNKPMNLGINEVVNNFPEFDAKVFFGGPVENNSLFYFHTNDSLKESSKEVLPGLFWGGDFEKLKELIKEKKIKSSEIRFFVGYAGWNKGQIDEEIADGSWIVANPTIEHIMSADDKILWKVIMKSFGKKYEILSNYPEDPSLN